MTPIAAAAALWLALVTTRPAGAQAAEPGWQHVPPPPEQDAEKLEHVRRHDGVFFRQGLGITLLRSRGRTADFPDGFDNGGFSPTTQGQTRLRAVSGPGIAAHVAVGGTPIPGLVFAFELTTHMYWNLDVETEEQPRVQQQFETSSQRDAKYLSYGLLALWYPQPKRGFNVGLSVAFASAHMHGPEGWFAGPQIGYEWWVGEQWSIGALLKASFSGLSSSSNRSFFERPFVGGDSAYVAMPSLAAVVTYH